MRLRERSLAVLRFPTWPLHIKKRIPEDVTSTDSGRKRRDVTECGGVHKQVVHAPQDGLCECQQVLRALESRHLAYDQCHKLGLHAALDLI